MCLSPKEVMFERPEESSQHLKLLYVWGHIDGKLISKMLIDGGTAVNLMPYSVFKKLGRENDELVKTSLMLNGVGGATRWKPEVSSPWTTLWGASRLLPCSLSLRCKWIDNKIEVVHADASAYIALPTPRPTSSMGAPSACREMILQATTFLVSPRKDLYPCL
jgi:hypothetical protein